MGFQRWLAKTHDIESISKARHDKSNGDHTSANLCGHYLDLNAASANYNTWLNEHPCALGSFKEMISDVKGKRIVVFLDYDGTLSPIVNDPDRAFMSTQMRLAVREVARHFPTAIISGRSRDKVYEFVKLDEVYYAGSHGMDIMGPPLQLKSYDGKYQNKALDTKGNEFTIFQPAQDFLPAIKKDYGTLEERIQSILTKFPRFHMTRGKKVLEIRPSIEWNKGHALEYLLDTLGFANSTNVLPLYIGDDRTDEDAFKVLRKRGEGYPIIVSSTPRDTMASYSLRDPSEVFSFLIRLARWGSETSSQ
ncbi:unnamed protein product [Ilex paraguariensis]|uniref:Trehalose 6-phosphate phosphatase n=1 Tax=Ilex paraguariensis TaxID=185542 RepID=A0ABC8R355_9AQUA